MAGGIALLRLGFMGRSLSKSAAAIVPRWAALLVVGGFVVTISIVGYVLLALTIVSLVIVLYRFDLRFLLRAVFVGVVTVALGWLLILGLGTEFIDKLETIPLIRYGVTGGIQTAPPTNSASALTLSANLSIALDNLRSNLLLGIGPGGHPVSYDVLVPDWARFNDVVYGTNQEDAGSLLIRLLSETGLIGTTLFIAGWLVVVVRARKAIQRALTLQLESYSPPSSSLVIAIGVTASCMALFVMYLLRSGKYFEPSMWILITLTAAIPPVLNRVYRDRPNGRNPSEPLSRKTAMSGLRR
jgi:O-antigen ligase